MHEYMRASRVESRWRKDHLSSANDFTKSRREMTDAACSSAVAGNCILLPHADSCFQTVGSVIPHCQLIFPSQAQNYGVKIYWNTKQYFASVLFRSRDGFAYDAAVLRAGPGATFRSVNFSSVPAVKGNTLPTWTVFCVEVISARDETWKFRH